ncbi:MAG: type II toxin-antitoxin system RelE/ParE family toxin [Gemmatimonadales bacterium]|nr:type II toxin-antitoxin system RelE/ParE family toxin [Gemmatimonadales bacterium]
MTTIRWTLQAVEDLEAIRDYVSRDSAHYARLLVERLYHSVDRLAALPGVGTHCSRVSTPRIAGGHPRILPRRLSAQGGHR